MTQSEGDGVLALDDSADIDAKGLASALAAGKLIQIMDVRAPERVARSRIDQVPADRYHNTRGSELMHTQDIESTGLDPDLPVVVVCGHGFDSKILAFHLGRLGLNARSLAGGLLAWMNHTVPTDLDVPEGLDRLVQFDRIGKGCLGYLLVSDGEAVVVDPPSVVDSYLKVLKESGANLVGVVDTHAHADYVSGAVSMATSLGVPYYLHAADAVYPYDGTPGAIEFTPISEGDTIPFGRTALRVVHTPGHTDGSVTLMAEDRVALTGDFLFVESIGRPDLGAKEEAWAGKLWDSMARAIREWDNNVAIYPAHYASERERRIGRAVGIPFGDLLAENEILKIQDPEVFLRYVLGRSGAFPESYRKIKAINLGLTTLEEDEVEELEFGRNECALGGITGRG